MRSYAKFPNYVIAGLQNEKGFREKPVPSPVTTNLVFYVDSTNPKSFDNSGTTWTDLTGTVNATLTNGPAYSQAWNGVIQFDGTDDYASIAYASSPFRQSSAITYDFWIKLTSGSWPMGTSVSGGQGSGGMLMSGTTIYFQWTPTTPPSDRYVYADFRTSATDTWKHICFTYNYSSASSYQFYEDGIPITGYISTNDVTNAVPTTSYNQSANDRIGSRVINSAYYTNATVPIVRIYSRALTAGEVWNNFNYDRKKFGL